MPIYAFNPSPAVCRRLALWWGVVPVQRALDRAHMGTAAGIATYLHQLGLEHAGAWVVVVDVHGGDGDMPVGVVAHHVPVA